MATVDTSLRLHGAPGRSRRRSRRYSALAVSVAVLALVLAACSDDKQKDGDSSSGSSSTTPTAEVVSMDSMVPEITLPRYQTDGSIRLTMSPEQPVFLYNAYVRDGADVVDEVISRWPKDLLGYLAFQIVFPAHDPVPVAERAAELEKFLERTDAAEVPAIVQTGVFTGVTGPTADELDAAFAAHPSLVGVGLAELSVDFNTVISGMSDAQKDMVADNIETAVRNNGLFLWADMGYLGPHVFVNAGADERLYGLMADNPDNIVIQAKQNGAGSRFTSMSAAFGFYAAGLATNWGINSEDWLWYEASLERVFGPQVTGGMTAAGMTRSEFLNRARRTYPESLYGTEMLVAASAGATFYSIEAPERGTVDPDIEGDSPAGPNVVFPVLRRLIAGQLIPDRDTVMERTRVAFQPADGMPEEINADLTFSGLYGPEGCTDADRLSCAQRQWLPSTGRYGIIPMLPALAPASVTDQFDEVLAPIGGSDDDRRAALDPLFPEPDATGSSWITAGGADGTWYFANPNENEDVTTDATIPLGDGRELHAEIGPHTFAMVDTRNGLSILVDNFRTDSDRLWDEAPSEEELEKIGLDEVGTAPEVESVIQVTLAKGAERPKLTDDGGTVTSSWDADNGVLTIKITHRGPVTLHLT